MESDTAVEDECAICLQKMELPVELPCKHKFCFLCIKGVRRRKQCALCRADFALKDIVEQTVHDPAAPSVCQWFYSSKNGNGWWIFDRKSQQEIEEAYQDPEQTQVVLSIGGYFYTCDFEKMIQYRSNHQERHRNIKRVEHQEQSDLNKDFTIKGIAGLKLQDATQDLAETVERLSDLTLQSSDGTS